MRSSRKVSFSRQQSVRTQSDVISLITRWIPRRRAHWRGLGMLVSIHSTLLLAGSACVGDGAVSTQAYTATSGVLRTTRPTFSDTRYVGGLFGSIERDEYFRAELSARAPRLRDDSKVLLAVASILCLGDGNDAARQSFSSLLTHRQFTSRELDEMFEILVDVTVLPDSVCPGGQRPFPDS